MTTKPDEMIAELERELTEARERLLEQREAHMRAQDEYPADAFEAGTRAAGEGERVRVARAKLEAAQRMRAACAAVAIEHVMPEGSRIEVMLPGKVDAAKVTIGAACGEAYEVGHERHVLCTEKRGHNGEHVSRGSVGREVARWPASGAAPKTTCLARGGAAKLNRMGAATKSGGAVRALAADGAGRDAQTVAEFRKAMRGMLHEVTT